MLSPQLDQWDESLLTEFSSILSSAFDLTQKIKKKKGHCNLKPKKDGWIHEIQD